MSLKEIGMAIYCTVVTLGFIGMSLMLYLHEIPSSQRDIALMVIGALIASFKDVGNYFTGSTASSGRKDDVIADLAKGPKSP